MDLFPEGAFVRLQNRANRKYVHADADWAWISLRRRGSLPPQELEAVWRVQHWVTSPGTTFLRLQSAAYGRYLALSGELAPPGHRGTLAVQADLEEPDQVNFLMWRWTVERVHPVQNYVRLRHFNRDLRANGRLRRWNTGVTVDFNRGRKLTTMMQWMVHLVLATSVPMPLPLPPAPAPQPQIQGGLLFWRRRAGVHQHPARTIRHLRASDEGNFDQNHDNWKAICASGHSVFNLRVLLGQLQVDWNGDMLGFTLCLRPGSQGRLVPLVTDLPHSLDPVYIVVFKTGSPAAAALRYPVL